jgi:hypothetical protein
MHAGRPPSTTHEPPVPDDADNITHQFDDGRMQPVDPDATITWHDLLRHVDAGGTFWLTVVDDDGRPHTRPVFAVVHDGGLVTASSHTAVKTAPLQAGNPCSIAVSAGDLDVVWSGIPTRVTDTGELHDIAERYRRTYGWDVDAHADALTAPYGAPTAGPPPYLAFRIRPMTVHAIATGDASTGRSTRWTFPPADPSARPR